MASTSFYMKAQSQASAAPFTISPKDLFPHVDQVDSRKKRIHMLESQAINVPSNNVTGSYISSSSLSNVLSSNGFADIILTRGSGCGPITDVTLKIQITNSTGAACTVSPAPLLINYVQILGNGGGVVVQQIQGFDLWLNTMLLDYNDWVNYSNVINTSSTWGAGTAIANGSSATYYVKLLGSVFQQCNIPLYALSGDIIIRTFFQGTLAVESGTVPTMTGLSALIEFEELPRAYIAKSMEDYNRSDITHSFKYLWYTQQLFSGTFNPSQMYQNMLAGANGLCPFFSYYLQAQGASGAELRQYQNLQQFNLLDSDGNSLIGGQPVDSAYNRYIQNSNWFDSDIFDNLAVFNWSHTLSPKDAAVSGKNYGFFY